MADNVDALIRRLVLSAAEIKELTNWPDAMVEDYLNILQTFIDFANAINDLGDEAGVVIEQKSADFEAGTQSTIYEVDCSAGDVTATLLDPADTADYQLAFRKIDSSTNKVIVVGDINGQTEKRIMRQFSIMNLYSNGLEYGIA